LKQTFFQFCAPLSRAPIACWRAKGYTSSFPHTPLFFHFVSLRANSSIWAKAQVSVIIRWKEIAPFLYYKADTSGKPESSTQNGFVTPMPRNLIFHKVRVVRVSTACGTSHDFNCRHRRPLWVKLCVKMGGGNGGAVPPGHLLRATLR
jgi:hypothetical protein